MGAWIGVLTLYAAKLSKKVYSIEPIAENFELLKKNVEMNPDVNEKTVLINKAIFNINGKVRMGRKRTLDDSTYSISSIGEEVDCITFATLLKEYKPTDVNICKMDLEGTEGVILAQMRDWLKNNKITLLLSTHSYFKVDKKSYFTSLRESLSIYPNIYQIGDDVLLCTFEDKKLKYWKKINLEKLK